MKISRNKLYLLNNWTLMKENICVNTLRTKNGGTWKVKQQNGYGSYTGSIEPKRNIWYHPEANHSNLIMEIWNRIIRNHKLSEYTWFAFNVFRKFPRLVTIPCQWAIKTCWAAVLATERDDPLTKLAREVLGAYYSDERKVFMTRNPAKQK